ncbi:hypothetical protein AgCh_000795 [Apium graveolens]
MGLLTKDEDFNGVCLDFDDMAMLKVDLASPTSGIRASDITVQNNLRRTSRMGLVGGRWVTQYALKEKACGSSSMGLGGAYSQIDFQYGSRGSQITLKEADSTGVEPDV